MLNFYNNGLAGYAVFFVYLYLIGFRSQEQNLLPIEQKGNARRCNLNRRDSGCCKSD